MVCWIIKIYIICGVNTQKILEKLIQCLTKVLYEEQNTEIPVAKKKARMIIVKCL